MEPGTYRNRFCCVREAVPLVPVATALPHAHTALGPQTALVVGVADEISIKRAKQTIEEERVAFKFANGKLITQTAKRRFENLAETNSV